MTASGAVPKGELDTTPEELRQAARFVEAVALGAVAESSLLAFPLALGGVKDFPRPAPDGRAALDGVRRLRRQLEEAVAELHAVASALEAGLPVPPVVLTPAGPYLDAYRAAAPEEQPYLVRASNERIDEDEFTPVDVDEGDEAAV
jgi:hypothetical protein